MKVSFIHTGDLHLGKQFHFEYEGDRFGREKRSLLWENFERIIQFAEQNTVSLLMISGDLFDSDEVDMAEVRRVADRLGSLSVTKTIIIAGNHDFYGYGSPYSMTEWPSNVFIFDHDDLTSMTFPELGVQVFGMSWLRDTYDRMPFEGRLKPDDGMVHLLMLHGDVGRGTSNYLPIDLSQFSNMDYIALGHVHKHQIINPKSAYCGSLTPLNFGETEAHGFLFGQLENGFCRIRFIPIESPQYIQLSVEISPKMSMDEIITQVNKMVSDESRKKDYYRIRLTGFYDVDLDLDWLTQELRRAFYYLELDFSGLEMDLDLDSLARDHANDVVGRFIRAMSADPADPISKKALYLGLKGLLPGLEGLDVKQKRGTYR